MHRRIILAAMNSRLTRVAKVAVLAAAASVGAALLYAVLFGPLFAFSPVKFGFDELRLKRCSVLYPRGATPDPAYAALDDLMAETEAFHGLKFRKDVRVIVCASNEQHRRFSRSSGHACTIQTGTVIYVRPSVAETNYPPRVEHQAGALMLMPPAQAGARDLEGFLKHELSHALLYQNTSLWKAMRINRWLEEGLAIHFGNAHHYYRGDELRTLAIDNGFWFDLTDENAEPPHIPSDIKHFFSYGLFGAFVKFLEDQYGRETVLDFVRAYIQAPGNEEPLFKSTVGAGLHETVSRFQAELTRARAEKGA